MKTGEVFAHCANCEAPLVVGMKLNMSPCEEHADCHEFYCDACVASVDTEDGDRDGPE